METVEILPSEISCGADRHGQRIAQHQRHGAAVGGGQIVVIRLRQLGDRQQQIAAFGQHGFPTGGEGHQCAANGPQGGNILGHFHRIAAVGDHNDQIILGDHTQIAVTGFRSVDEGGHGAGAGKGGCQFFADVGAFAHTQKYQLTLAVQNRFRHRFMLRA